jgi:hypothetical protein
LKKNGQRVPDLFIVDALDKLSASKLKGTSDFILTAGMLGLE